MKSGAFTYKSMSQLVEKIVNPVKVCSETLYEQIGIRSHGKGIFYKEAVVGKALGNKRVFWVEPDCLIINIVFAWEQAVARTRDADRGKIASHRFPMFRPKYQNADLGYLIYIFKTEFGKHLLTLASPGGAGRNKTLGQAEFMRIKIPCPPVTEQKIIAEILSTWDRAIETTEKLIENSKAQKKALMQQLLTGKRRLPGFNDNWKNLKFKKFSEILYGSSPKGVSDVNGNYPIIGTGGVVGHSNKYTFDKSSIVIGRKGTIDKPQLIDGPFWAIDTTYFCKIKPDYDLEWLYQCLNTINLKKYNESSGVPSLSRDTLYSISFNTPPIEEQKAISSILKTANNIIVCLERKQKKLIREKFSLMQQLLSGKRRVKLKKEDLADAHT